MPPATSVLPWARNDWASSKARRAAGVKKEKATRSASVGASAGVSRSSRNSISQCGGVRAARAAMPSDAEPRYSFIGTIARSSGFESAWRWKRG